MNLTHWIILIILLLILLLALNWIINYMSGKEKETLLLLRLRYGLFLY